MAYDTPKLTDEQTLNTARDLLEEHLTLEADGYHCQRPMLFDVRLGACAAGQTSEATCRDLESTPSAETLRPYLRTGLSVDSLPELEEQLNHALTALIPPRLRRKAQEGAADFHDRAYDGQQQQQAALWVRARAKRGTPRFFRIATAYVVHKGMPLRLAVHFVRPEERTVEVLKALLERITHQQVPIGCLLLDKGFAGITGMKYLAQQKLPAIMACPIRGKKEPRPSATGALCRGRASYRTRSTFSNEETSFTAPLGVGRVFTTSRRTGRMRRRSRWLIFIVIGEPLRDLSPRQIRRRYRRRFSIETSYRLAGKVRASRDRAELGVALPAHGPELLYGERVGASVLALHAGAASRWAMARQGAIPLAALCLLA